jgi:hypothetical protein
LEAQLSNGVVDKFWPIFRAQGDLPQALAKRQQFPIARFDR